MQELETVVSQVEAMLELEPVQRPSLAMEVVA